jgi:hypothetical protein
METKTIARINETTIQVVNDNGTQLIPVKPICEALGIAYEPQFTKLKDDDFLSSVTTIAYATGSDGKTYEMVCIPLKYVFGWLFTINPKNVKEEARESVAKCRNNCYDVLSDYISLKSDFLEYKQTIIEKKMDEFKNAVSESNILYKKAVDARDDLMKVKDLTYEEWKMNQRQTTIDFIN